VQRRVRGAPERQQHLAAQIPDAHDGTVDQTVPDGHDGRERLAAEERLDRDRVPVVAAVEHPEVQLAGSEALALRGAAQVRDLRLEAGIEGIQRADERLYALQREIWDATDAQRRAAAGGPVAAGQHGPTCIAAHRRRPSDK